MASQCTGEEQATLMEEALGYAAEQRFYLRKAISNDDMEMALRHGLALTNELRSSKLYPENYYKLYILVFWELQHLAAFMEDVDRHGVDIAEIYEVVQYEGNVLSRLYMLVTTGAVRMWRQNPEDDVLNDLSSMLTAVQHPVRGLFLRYYLLQMVKDKLLDLRGVKGAVQFLLVSLRECASLWARLRLEEKFARQPSGSPQPEMLCHLDGTRHTLRLLVGAHIVHLARMPGVSLELHAEAMMPEVLRLSTTCEDAAGQAYLLQCYIEALPDHFHLGTLDSVLAACSQIHWRVDLSSLLQHIICRLTKHVLSSREEASSANQPEVDACGLFHKYLKGLHMRPRSVATPLLSLLELQVELAMMALALHPGDGGRMELVLGGTVELLRQRGADEGLDDLSVSAIIDLLASPLTQEALLPAVLAMPHHETLKATLGRTAQREAALSMIAALLAGQVCIGDCETLRRLLVLIDPLIRDEGGNGNASGTVGGIATARHLEHSMEAFTDEQAKVACFVHQVCSPDPDITFQMLSLLYRYLKEGGPHRVVFTLPPMIVATLQLVWSLPTTTMKMASNVSEGRPPKVMRQELFAFAHQMCTRLGSVSPMEGLRQSLLCATSADRAAKNGCRDSEDRTGCSQLFLDGALACLENIHSSETQFLGLQLLVGALRQTTCLDKTCYAQVAERAVHFAGRLKTKRLQSKAFNLCSGLFWCPAFHEPGRALSCIRMALRLADSAIHIDPMDVGLFVEVLDQAAQHFATGSEEVTAGLLESLLELCAEHLRYVEPRTPTEALRSLRATMSDLEAKQRQALRNSPWYVEDNPTSIGESVDPRHAQLRLEVAPGLLPASMSAEPATVA